MIIPYQLYAQIGLLAGGQGSFQYSVPQGQILSIDEFVFTSTSGFNLIGLSNASGLQFTNASGALGIPSIVLASGGNNNNAIRDFKPDLVIKGGDIFTMTLLDTSGAPNTVKFLFNCSKELPSQ